MALDGTTFAAIGGFLGTLCATVGGVFVATRTNRSEKASTALKTLEDTKDEVVEARMKLKDDQISDIARQLSDCKIDNKLRIEELESEIDKKNLQIEKLKESNGNR